MNNRLIQDAFEAESLKAGLEKYFYYLRENYLIDYLKLYLVLPDSSFLHPYLLFGNPMNLGPLSLNEKQSLIVNSYLKNQETWIENVETSPYVASPLLKKQGIKMFFAIPFINQGVVNIEYLEKKEISFESLGLETRTVLTILLNRFYLVVIKEELKRSIDDIQKQISVSKKLSYLGQIASSFAHEIKNPLTTIKLLIANFQEKSKPGSDDWTDLNVIQEEIERINRLLSDFLNFAKPSLPKFEKILISEIISRILTIVNPRIKEKNIQIVSIFKDEPYLEADKDQLQQVFLNLLLNAIEALPDQNGQISFKGEKKVKKGQAYYQILVEDNGKGIRDEILPKIFEPFFSETGKGTGLGLFIVHRLVENHRGFIEAYNQLYGGATFSIYLPLEKG